MKTLSPSVLLFAALACPVSTAVQAASPHVHGVGTLDLAVDGTELFIELHSPAADVFGFEHAPRTAEQHAAVAAAMDRLADGASLFRTPGEAACALREAVPASPFDGEHDHGHDDHDAHTDVSATYGFVCAAAPDWIEVDLFEAFPGMRRLDVQFITAAGQGKAVLGPGAGRLDLR